MFSARAIWPTVKQCGIPGPKAQIIFRNQKPGAGGRTPKLILLLQSGSLERIPVSRVDQRLGASVMRVGRGVDLAARADLGVAVVKRHYRPAKVAGWLDPFIVRKTAFRHDLRIHAGVLPPKAGAPDRRPSVRFLVANDQILRGVEYGASFEGVVH